MNTNAAQRGGGGGAERRRYERLPIRLDALITIDGRPAVPCSVRDFCIAGIFAALSPQQLRLAKADTNAVLYFSLIVDGAQQDHQLGLTICRVVGSGIGCGFSDPDPKTVQLLQSLAEASRPQAVPDTAEAMSNTQRGFSPRFEPVREKLQEATARFAGRTADEFIRLTDNALFLHARDAKNNREETRFLDAQNEFRRRAEAIRDNVPRLLHKAISILNNPLSQAEADGGDEPGLSELSLVDKDEFEEFLTVSQLVSELEPQFKDPLFQLDHRFSLLANREVDERTNPIGPAVLGAIFAEELKNLQSDRSAINVIYRNLRKALEPNLQRLYDEVNEMLIAADILPVIEKGRPKIKRSPDSSTSNPAAPVEDFWPAESTAPPPLQRTHNPAPDTGTPPRPAAHQGPVQAAPPPRFVAPPAPGAAGGAGFEVIDPGNVAAGQAPPPAGHPSVVPGSPSGAPAGSVGAPQVSGAPPSQVSAGVPATPATGGAVPVGYGLEATFGGFGTGPAVYVPPSLQQAYSAAQTQMALRRELLPPGDSEAITVNAGMATYPPAQVIGGLTRMQQSFADTLSQSSYDVQSIKNRIIDAITRSGGEPGAIGQPESDALEVIANLFQVLIEDALLTETAKSQLMKLQAPVHKTALMDPAFFEATDHPVRQLLNRVSMLRDGQSEGGSDRNERVSDLISRFNSEFDQDVSMMQPMLDELDQIIREQRDSFNGKVEQVVSASEEHEKILSERRGKNPEATDSSLASTDLPEEWNRWLDRGKLLEAGDRMIMNATSAKPSLVTLVWVGPNFNPYVFVDDKGDKSATLTLQQVAMYLRRGTLKPLQNENAGAVDRALFGVVNRMHGQVEERATQDELTHFMNRKAFLQLIERHLPEQAGGNTSAVLCQISLENLKEVNTQHGTEVGDELLNNVAQQLRECVPGKAVSFGRLSGTELAVFWHKGGLQNAYAKMQLCFETLEDAAVRVGDETLLPVAYAGITAIDDRLTSPEQLIAVVEDACKIARTSGDKQIYVAGSENKFREQLEQMVAYIGKAHDRDRLVLLHQLVKSLADDSDRPALHIVVTAEDRNGKLVPPEFFAQALASSDRSFEIDEWTLKQTFSWMASHSDEIDAYAAIIVPLSHQALRRDDLSNVIINLLMETAVPPGKIFFEIDDKDAIANVTETAELVRTLKEFGCRFILDEFGSGQGNYEYVKELAVDFVTIETGFIADARDNPKDFAMAKSINELIHFMGKKTIGKQDRGRDVTEVLREIGVDFLYDQTKTNRIAA